MKKTNIFKIVMTLVLAFVVTGAFAQIDITVNNPDGTPATDAVMYTLNSSTGVSTAIVADADDGTSDGVITGFTPTANTNYLISNSGGTTWNSYSTPAAPANITIVLNSNFTETIQEYAANHTADKVTINKDMPFWVYPSPIHNPGWAPPAAANELETTIVDDANLSSTFVWGIDGGTAAAGDAADDNYVELQWGTTGVKTITVTETADAAYGGCSGELKTFFTEVIDIPYVEFNNGADGTPAYTIGGSAINVILSECESVGTTIDPTLEFGDNADEEFPYYIRLNYTVHNATIDGSNNITLDAAETMPAAVDIQGDIAASTVSGTNPLIVNSGDLTGTTLPLLGGASAFPTVNNDITVYVLNMSTNGYNAKISRKSDYVAMRDNGGTPANWDDGNYSWYTDDNSGANELDAYIVILPAPQTGPIYHIPNSWGL